MTTRDMMYICTISDMKSITKAAKSLYIAQPALSQCVQKVESEVGSTIFSRSRSGIEETEIGKKFLKYARTVLREENSFKKELADIKNNLSGHIRLAMSGRQARYVLPKILPKFQKEHPNISINLIEGHTINIMGMLKEGTVDLGIFPPYEGIIDFSFFELYQDEMVVVPKSSSDYKKYVYKKNSEKSYIDLKFLINEPIMLTESGFSTRLICDEILVKANVVPNFVNTNPSLSSIDVLAQSDYITSILPEKQMSNFIKNKGYFYIESNFGPRYPVYVVTQKESYISLATECFIDYLKSIKEIL